MILVPDIAARLKRKEYFISDRMPLYDYLFIHFFYYYMVIREIFVENIWLGDMD